MTMNQDSASSNAAALRSAEILLSHLLPPSLRLTAEEVESLTLQTGLWALATEVEVHERALPKTLRQQLSHLRRPPAPVSALSTVGALAPAEVTEVRRRAESFGQPWPLGQTVRNGVTQTSYRVYPALLERAQTLYPRQPQLNAYDLQITLALAYLALPTLQQKVNALLRLRYANSRQGSPEAKEVERVLREANFPWQGRVTLRGPVKQVAMRVTTTFAAALRQEPPSGLHCTIADLHTTLLALYIADQGVPGSNASARAGPRESPGIAPPYPDRRRQEAAQA